jgi:hypothetical protein
MSGRLIRSRDWLLRSSYLFRLKDNLLTSEMEDILDIRGMIEI